MKRFRFTLHNCIGHPVMEILYIFGFKDLGMWFHDYTLPKDWEQEYSDNWEAGEYEEGEDTNSCK